MGAVVSDYFTSAVDVSNGFVENDGVTNLHELAAVGKFHRVRICLKKGRDPNEKSFREDDLYGREESPIICATRGTKNGGGTLRHLKTIRILHQFGGDVNAINLLDQSALLIACQKGYLQIAGWLIANGADINRPDKAGKSPLMWSCERKHTAIVKLLLNNHAKTWRSKKKFGHLNFPTVSDIVGPETAEIQDSGTAKVHSLVWEEINSEKKKREDVVSKDNECIIDQNRMGKKRKNRKKMQKLILDRQRRKYLESVGGSNQSQCNQEETSQKNLRIFDNQFSKSGKWQRTPEGQWKYMYVCYENRKEKEKNTIYDQSEELYNSLMRKRHNNRLREIKTAPDSMISYQKRVINLANMTSSEFRPISAPVLSPNTFGSFGAKDFEFEA